MRRIERLCFSRKSFERVRTCVISSSPVWNFRLLATTSIRLNDSSEAKPIASSSSSSEPDSIRETGHSSTAVSPSSTSPHRLRFDENEGLSPELGGFGHFASSITGFMDPAKEKRKKESLMAANAPLPCERGEDPNDLPSDSANVRSMLQSAQAESMNDVLQKGGSLPLRGAVPLAAARKPPAFLQAGKTGGDTPRISSSSAAPSSLPKALREKTASRAPAAKSIGGAGASDASASTGTSGVSQEVADYYRSLPKNALSKEEMWRRIQEAQTDKNERAAAMRKTESPSGGFYTTKASEQGVLLDPHDVDFLKMEEELKEHDPWHYKLGAYAFNYSGKAEEDEMVLKQRRYDYYAMWTLGLTLNKARWNMLEVSAQRGVKTTGAGMKILFWKEAVRGILQTGSTSGANFTDSHPVLRPFASAVSRHPKLTKAFIRGFTDARLRALQQPANVQQLFDHFDKFYGYFFNTLLEITDLKDEAAEHALLHIGRAYGLTTHSVMFWKKYATLGVTLLPADLCADHCVHLGLLKRISLASRDRAVRRLLCDVMAIAKYEMLQAEKLAKDIHPKTWPILMECFYPNYYLTFLQKRDFNVSAMFADYNIENLGLVWYRVKKRMEWQRTQSIEKLLCDEAPLPIIHRPIFYRGAAYKMATPARGSSPNVPGVKLPPSSLSPGNA